MSVTAVGRPNFLPHLGAKLAMLDGVGPGLPEVMQQGSAPDQLEIESGSRAVGDLERLGGRRQAVLDVVRAYPGLPEKLHIRVRHTVQPYVLALHDSEIVQDAFELALGLGHEGVQLRSGRLTGGVSVGQFHRPLLEGSDEVPELALDVIVDVLDELLGGLDSVFGFDHPGVIHHPGDIVAFGFLLFEVHEGVHRLVGVAGLLHAGFDVNIGLGHWVPLGSAPQRRA